MPPDAALVGTAKSAGAGRERWRDRRSDEQERAQNVDDGPSPMFKAQMYM